MQVHNVEQGTEEWHNLRLGVPTASRFSDIITPSKGDLSKSADKYMNELIAEKITLQREQFKMTDWMERGNELEAEARDVYSFLSDNEVTEVGFITNDDGTIGASPDGLIGKDGGLEIKCPKASTMVKYLDKNILPI